MAEIEQKQELLQITNPPHIRSGESVPKVMWTVVAALVPATAFSFYLYGLNALLLVGVGIAAAVVGEAAVQLFLRRPVAVSNGSAVITGLLLAMNVPPMAPWWTVAIGSLFSVIIVKQLFGGLGFNIFNPALAGRAFLMASWPIHMTTAWYRFSGGNVLSPSVRNAGGLPDALFDTMTGATPLGLLKEGPRMAAQSGVDPSRIYDVILSPGFLKSLSIGTVGGCIGETSAIFLLAGALFLLARRIITWHIPVSYIGTVALLAAAYYYATGFPAPQYFVLFHILSGGLILGAFFMATDMVTSPVSPRGMIIFGAGCGILAFVIRIWGGYPEGVSYSILIMNAFVPLIDRYTRPGVFGAAKRKSGGSK